MNQTYTVRCSDCGCLALRTRLTDAVNKSSNCFGNQIIKTECPSCDYLLITCSANGNVIDAHSSTTSVIARKQNLETSPSAIPIAIEPRVKPWSTKLSA